MKVYPIGYSFLLPHAAESILGVPHHRTADVCQGESVFISVLNAKVQKPSCFYKNNSAKT